MSHRFAYPSSLIGNSRPYVHARSKEEATTKNQTVQRSQQEQQEWSSQEDLSPKCQKIKKLEEKISKVKMAQEQLQEKFEKVVEHISQEIIKKDETNEQLQKQIEMLQNFLNESKGDLGIIKNYLKKQQLKQSCKQNTRKTVNLNETVFKTNKSTSRNQIFTDITVQSIVTSRKSISPRMKLLKKQIKG